MADGQRNGGSDKNLEAEVERLQNELRESQQRLEAAQSAVLAPRERYLSLPKGRTATDHRAAPSTSSTHFLLLLSDSALPLGSFAFSSGLESFLAHEPRAKFGTFLPSSLSSYASANLPFVIAGYRNPATVAELDDELDAAIICTVGRRASVAQGRALLSVWERSFRKVIGLLPDDMRFIDDFSKSLRDGAKDEIPMVSAHLAPLFGAICQLMGLSLRQTAYVFMLSHVKALVSAAVRASMFGPFQAQKILAGEDVQRMIDILIEREWETPVEEAGQTVPVMDLWVGRHEMLYSRIFNS